MKTAAVFNHEAKDTYSIRVRSTDSGGLSCEEVFTITVNDVSEVLVPGDANDDGHVDHTDAQILAMNWGSGSEQEPATWAQGNFDDDYFVGPKDAAIMAANWGHGTGEATGVPEPSVLAMLVIGALLWAVWRRAR